MKKHLDKIRKWSENFQKENHWKNEADLFMLYKNREILIIQEMIALAMIESAKRYGSRGSAFVLQGSDFMSRSMKIENADGRKKVLTLTKNGKEIKISERAVHPLPDRNLWFEKVWNTFNDMMAKKGRE